MIEQIIQSEIIIPVLLFLFGIVGLIIGLKNDLSENAEQKLLWRVNLFFALLYVLYAFTKSLTIDEIEHIQSAWLIAQGEIPYRDFFQHHHPLLWYLTAPVFFMSGNNLHVIYVFRLLNILLLAGIFRLVYSISIQLSQSKKTALYSISMLLAITIFTRNAIEFRPDVLMTFFVLASFYIFLLFLRSQKTKHLFFSGLLLTSSFFTLQKASFFIAPFFVLLIWLVIQKKIKWKNVFILGGTSFLSLFAVVLIYFWAGISKEFVALNWMYNVLKPAKSTISQIFMSGTPVFEASNFIALTLFALVFFVLKGKKMPFLIQATFLIGLFQCLFILKLSTFYMHYFIIAVPFVIIAAAYYFNIFTTEKHIPAKYSFIMLVALFVLTFPALFKKVNDENLFTQIKEFQYIQNKTKNTDVVFSSFPAFLFEKSAHFMFYQTRIFDKGNLVLSEIANNPSYEYLATQKLKENAVFNPLEIIQKQKPVFIKVDTDFIDFYQLNAVLEKNYQFNTFINCYELIQ